MRVALQIRRDSGGLPRAARLMQGCPKRRAQEPQSSQWRYSACRRFRASHLREPGTCCRRSEEICCRYWSETEKNWACGRVAFALHISIRALRCTARRNARHRLHCRELIGKRAEFLSSRPRKLRSGHPPRPAKEESRDPLREIALESPEGQINPLRSRPQPSSRWEQRLSNRAK